MLLTLLFIFVVYNPDSTSYPYNLSPASPCHQDSGPTDQSLQCDSSPHQILFVPGSRNLSDANQKENLIILDIDQTILEMHPGFHPAIPPNHTQSGVRGVLDLQNNLAFMFMPKPRDLSIIFRRHFFDILHYMHTNSGFLADLVLYTRARYEYAAQIVFGINQCYNQRFHNKTEHLSMYP